MDNQKAKFVLQSYRRGTDADDPQFAEALRCVERDAELAGWFVEEQGWDDAIRRKLKEVPAPENLLDRILAEKSGLSIRAENPSPKRGLITRASFALAAALVILSVVTALFFYRRSNSLRSFAAYRTQMISAVAYGVRLDFQNTDVSHLQKWLAENRGLSGFVIPAGLQNKPGIGCRTFSWQGKPVGLLCFLVGPNEAVHLFVVSREALANAPVGDSPQFAHQGDWLTASWSQGDVVYVAAAHAKDEAYLQKFL